MPLRLGPAEFPDEETVVMAIVNRTPDSFYDRGATFELAAAVATADRAVADGARIVDVGGVPAGGGPPVDVAEEIDRVRPVVRALREAHPHVVVSVDTWRAEVAEACAHAGAHLFNDAWGGADPRLAEVAAARGTGLVCTHAGGAEPRTQPADVRYRDVVAEVKGSVVALAERAVALGVRPDAILVDPGHDFAKRTEHSLLLTRRLDELVATGWPVLAAISRKDFIGETLGRAVEDRLAGTLAVTAVCAWLGARVFRVHDVSAVRDVLDVVGALRRALSRP